MRAGVISGGVEVQTDVDLEALVTSVGDAIVACNSRGTITLWNSAAERMFGFPEAEALGKSLDLIIPERLRERHWDGYRKTMETGQTKYGEDVLRVPAVDKAGRSMSIAFSVALLFDDSEQVSVIVSIIRDETSRFQEGRKLRKRLAELESKLAEVQ